ncbi:MAG: PIG-L family deacetylase, partial [Rhodothermales bacterium]
MPYLRFRIALVLLFLAAPSVLAQPASYQPADALVVMNLAAHPDDEDGSTLAYYRRAKNAAAYSVIFTRGEGGQNEIGPELYEELGAIRTDETERAARHLGTEVYFLNFDDFGYSKEASEAFERWGGRDEVTGRLVYLVRKLKPDVLFTNHDTVTVGPGRSHGQHQAVGVAAYDAFALAADAGYRPEQLEEDGVDLWQPKRLFLRRWRGSEGGGDVAVQTGDVYPPEGKSYAEIAGEAISEHASQGMGQFGGSFRGRSATGFVLLRSATDVPLGSGDLAAGLPPNDTAQPTLDYLIDAGRVPSLPQGTLRLNDSTAVPGQTVRLSWTSGALPAPDVRWHLEGSVDTTFEQPSTNELALTIAQDALPTFPKARYQYERFTNEPPVTYALYQAGTDSLMAAGYLPLEIAPPLVVEGGEPVVRLAPGSNRIPVEAEVFDPEAERLSLRAVVTSESSSAPLAQVEQELPFSPGEPIEEALLVELPDTLAEGTYTIALTATAE